MDLEPKTATSSGKMLPPPRIDLPIGTSLALASLRDRLSAATLGYLMVDAGFEPQLLDSFRPFVEKGREPRSIVSRRTSLPRHCVRKSGARSNHHGQF